MCACDWHAALVEPCRRPKPAARKRPRSVDPICFTHQNQTKKKRKKEGVEEAKKNDEEEAKQERGEMPWPQNLPQSQL